MSDLSAIIEVSADASGVETGLAPAKKSISNFKASAIDAGNSAGGAFDKSGDGAKVAANKVEAATKNIIGSIQRQIAITEAGAKSNAEYYRVLADQRGIDRTALQPYLDQLDAVKIKQIAATGALQGAAPALDKIGVSAKQTAAALRGVPAQFTDIVVSLQGGQAPLTVLLQQGGQLKDMFGGVGNAARALGGYVAGLVNPFTLAAAAAAGLGYIIFKGQQEQAEYAKALILSGNAAGATAGQLQDYAKAIAQVSGTQGNAAEAVTAFAASGKIGAQNLEAFALAAVKFEKATGQAVAETVKQFVELGKSPVEASVKLTDQYGYLTLATYKEIKALEDQGRAVEAANLAQKTFADTLQSRTGQIVDNTGAIARGWNSVKSAVSGAVDALMNIGRVTTPADTLAALKTQLTQRQERNQSLGIKDGKATEELRVQISYLEEQERMVRRSAVAAADRNQINALGIEFSKQGAEFETKAAKLQKETLKATVEGNQLVKAGLLTQVQLNERLSAIKDKYKEAPKSGGAATGESEVAGLKARITQEAAYLAQLKERGAQAEKLTFFEQASIKINEELKTTISGGARAQKEKALAVAQSGVAMEKETAALVKQISLIKKAEEETLKQAQAVDQSTKSYQLQAEDLNASNAVFGKGKTAIAEYRLEETKRLALMADSSENFSPAYVAALNNQVAAQERFVVALKASDYKDIANKQTEATRAIEAAAQAYQDEAVLAGLTGVERAKVVALRKIELDLAKEIAEIDRTSLSESDKQSLRDTARNNAARAGQVETAKIIADEYVKTADIINQSLTDALLNSSQKGIGFFKSLANSIRDIFKKLVLEPTVKAAVGGITGALGFGGQASAATEALGGGGGGMLSQGKSIYDAISGGFSSIGASVSSTFSNFAVSSVGQSMGLSTTVQAMGPAMQGALAPTMNVMTSTASSMASAAGSMASAGAGIVAGLGLRSAIGGNMSMGRGMDNFQKVGVGVASIIGGPILGAIAGAGMGLLNRAFGMGPKQPGATGLRGSLNVDAASTVENYSKWTQQGGWFRSSKSGTDTSAISGDAQKYLDASVLAMSSTTRAYAASLGLSAQTINGFTKSIDISLAGLDAKGQAAAIETTLADFGSSLASAVLGASVGLAKEGESATATLARLSTSLVTVNSTFGLLGKTLMSADVAGAAMSSSLIDIFGGVEKFAAAADTFYQNFYTDEEKRLNTIKAINAATAGSGLDAATATRESFKALVLGIKPVDEASQKMLASLLGVSGALSSILPPLDAVGKKISDIMKGLLDERGGLEANLLDAKGDGAGASASRRQQAIAGFAEAEIAAYDYNRAIESQIIALGDAAQAAKDAVAAQEQAAKDAIAAQQRASEAAAAIATQRGQIELSILGLQGDAAGVLAIQRGAELKALDASLVPLKLLEYGLQDMATAATAAAAKANAAAATYFAEIDRTKNIDTLKGESTSALDKFFATTTSGANAAIDAAQSAQAAAKSAAENWRSAAKSIESAIDAIRNKTAEVSGNAYTNLLAQFQTQTVLARGGDAGAAGQLSGIASSFLSTSESQSETLVDYLRDRARVENSLVETLGQANAGATVQDSIAAATQATVAQLEAANVTLSGFSAQVFELLSKSYQGASRPEATAAAGNLATMTGDFANWFSKYKTGDSIAASAFSGGLSYNKINESTFEVQNSSGKTDYIRAGESILEIAKRLPEISAAWEQQYGIKLPGFAAGGMFGGGLRIVGENGPEIEATGPSRIFSASQTRSMLQGGGNTERLESLVEMLTAKVEELTRLQSEGNQNTRSTSEAVNGNQRTPLVVQVINAAGVLA